MTNIVSLPCEHFSVAQDTLSRPRFPGGTFGFDHLVDRAAIARNSEGGHGRKRAPVRLRHQHITITVRPRVSRSPASARGPFCLLWQPLPCFQKRRAKTLSAPTDRHGKFPISMLSAGSLATSRRPRSQSGQILLLSCTINGDGRLNFQTAPNAKCASSSGGSQGLECLLLAQGGQSGRIRVCPLLTLSGTLCALTNGHWNGFGAEIS